MNLTYAAIKQDPRLAHLWPDNPTSSDQIRALDIAIGEAFPDAETYVRPLVPFEVMVYCDPKEQVSGAKGAPAQVAKELAGCNAAEITVLRDANGKQLGRIRAYGFMEEMRYEQGN